MTRQQRWAADALKRVQAQEKQSIEGEYRTLCLKMPILIKQSGLVQALSFMWSRDKEDQDKKKQQPGKLFCNDLARVYGIPEQQDVGKELLEKALKADDLSTYLAMTRDLIDVSVWFRRFAQSELQGQGEQ